MATLCSVSLCNSVERVACSGDFFERREAAVDIPLVDTVGAPNLFLSIFRGDTPGLSFVVPAFYSTTALTGSPRRASKVGFHM
jgi:hypothetical protein